MFSLHELYSLISMDKSSACSDGEIRDICGALAIMALEATSETDNCKLEAVTCAGQSLDEAAVIKADATAAINSVAETGDTTSSVSNATSDQGTVDEKRNEEDPTKLTSGASTSVGSETSKEGLDDAQQIKYSEAVDAENEQEENTAEAVQLRQQLKEVLQRIRRNTADQRSPEERRFKNERFHTIYTIVCHLMSNGHSLRILNNQTLEISSRDGSWSEEIEYQVAYYLDIHYQLIEQQFELDEESPCPTILSAEFDQKSNIQLSPYQGDHYALTNAIYAIRCWICSSNVKYVGQSEHAEKGTSSIHKRVCTGHAWYAKKAIDNFNKSLPVNSSRPMYVHATEHFIQEDLPQGTQPHDAFRQTMDVILLPIGPIESKNDLRSWEVFWQFFLHCRKFFGGWSQL